jgi:hypothetical protein
VPFEPLTEFVPLELPEPPELPVLLEPLAVFEEIPAEVLPLEALLGPVLELMPFEPVLFEPTALLDESWFPTLRSLPLQPVMISSAANEKCMSLMRPPGVGRVNVSAPANLHSPALAQSLPQKPTELFRSWPVGIEIQ